MELNLAYLCDVIQKKSMGGLGHGAWCLICY
jgi:hypothetical protein